MLQYCQNNMIPIAYNLYFRHFVQSYSFQTIYSYILCKKNVPLYGFFVKSCILYPL